MLVYIVQYRTLYLNFVSIQGFTGCSKITFLQYILFLLTYCKQCFQLVRNDLGIMSALNSAAHLVENCKYVCVTFCENLYWENGS